MQEGLEAVASAVDAAGESVFHVGEAERLADRVRHRHDVDAVQRADVERGELLRLHPDDLRRLMPDQGANPAKLSQTGYRDNVQFRRENNWLRYLLGKNPGYPEQALRADFARIRARV